MEIILLAFKTHVYWVLIVTILMFVSIFTDLVTGVINAIKKGDIATSYGFRRTCRKINQYFVPLIPLGCIDVLFTSFQIWAAPWFVILFGVYVIWCEFVSVLENTRGKQGAKLITDMIIKIMTSKGDKDKMVDALSDAVNETSVEAKPVTSSKTKTKKKSSVEG